MSGNWTDQIPGCFGATDKIFAGHAAEEDRAFDLLKKLRADGVGWGAAKKAVRGYLAAEGVGKHDIDDQVKEVERHFRPWLVD